jgi:hypothetical protein
LSILFLLSSFLLSPLFIHFLPFFFMIFQYGFSSTYDPTYRIPITQLVQGDVHHV